jgi:galactokinase
MSISNEFFFLSGLPGAGWGGCTVSLVKEADVPRFLSELRKGYGPFKDLDDATFASACFATKPAEGACGECSRRALTSPDESSVFEL